MAQEDNYKEGVDYVMVDKGGYKSRHFLSKAEKAAKNAPPAKAATPKPAAKKTSFSVDMAKKAIDKASAKDQPMKSSPRPKKRPEDTTPKPVAAPAKISTTAIPKSTSTPDTKKTSSYTIPVLAVGAAGAGASGGTRRADSSRAYNPSFGKSKSMPSSEGPQGRMKGTEVSSARGGSGRGGTMLGNDPMFHAISGGGFGELQDIKDRNLLTYKKGGAVKMKEGSAKDTREDKVKAKKAGMTMTKWESSAADKKHDAPKKMACGGVVKKATGGSMRGTGAAVRGKGFSGSY